MKAKKARKPKALPIESPRLLGQCRKRPHLEKFGREFSAAVGEKFDRLAGEAKERMAKGEDPDYPGSPG